MTRLRSLNLLVLLLAAVGLFAVPSRGGQSLPNPAGPAQSSQPRTPTRLVRPAVPEDFAVAHHAQPQQGAGPEFPVLFVRDVSVASGAIDGGNEPSIAVDPNNPNRIVALSFAGGWSPNAPLWFSTDGGLTWAKDFTIGFPPGDPNGGPNDQAPD